MRALIISENDLKKIQEVVAFARDNPVSRERILATMKGDVPPAGDYLRHTLHLQDGYRIVYTEEDQPAGSCAHMSVSVEGVALPNPVAVNHIMEAYGMGPLDESLNVWIEEDRAINILALLKRSDNG